jgi:type IV secretory pathway TraG/TraD family ATPase VirD4
MSPTPLKTGQGLVAHGLGAALQRWLGYARIVAATATVLSIAFTLHRVPEPSRDLAGVYALARFKLWIAEGQPLAPTVSLQTRRGSVLISAEIVARSRGFQAAGRAVAISATAGALAGVLLGGVLSAIWAYWMERRGQVAALDRKLRGSAVISERALAQMTAKRANRSALYIAGVPLPEDLETRHAALIGSTGSGKTTALRQLLDGIERRGASAIVYDTSGEFVAHYYDPARGDVILNPFDQRGAFWNPFAEIAHPADADRLAAQLITANEDSEGDVWTSTARLLVANIMRALWREGRGDLPSLLAALQGTSKADLKVWLAGSSSARTFEDDADRASGSVLFMLSEAVNLLQYLRAAPGAGGTFSFRAFFKGLDRIDGPKPWIFVPRKEDYFEATKPLLACWLECAAGAVLGLDPHPTRRVWMMLDELPDIPKVDNLQRLLPQGRKFGAAVVLTFQAIGQMRDRYGKDGSEALLGCANTKLFLQLIDADSRKWASQTVGEVEVEMRGTTESLAFEVGKGRTSLGSQRQIRAALIESEFRLPRHEGFLQLPDGLPVARIRLSNRHILKRGAPRQPGYVVGDVADTLWGVTPAPALGPVIPERGPV